MVEEGCTALHGVPTHFLGVLSEVEKRKKGGVVLDFSHLRSVCLTRIIHCAQADESVTRTGIGAGTSIPIDLMKTLGSDLNLTELTIAYGMSEWCIFNGSTTRLTSCHPQLRPGTRGFDLQSQDCLPDDPPAQSLSRQHRKTR